MNFKFSHKQDEDGYHEAIEEGRTWTVLDIWFAEDTEGRLYWEVELDKWFPDKDPLWEVTAYGHGEGKGHDKFEQLIKEKQPDEYFCSTYPDGSMNTKVYSKWGEN